MTAEFDLIDLIAEHAGPAGAHAVIGIGDDAAVLEPVPGEHLVATMDTLNAGIHFHADVDPFRLGHKSLAVNLSDLASMGAQPRWILLSLSLPSSDAQWLRPFIRGFLDLAHRHGARLVGGDTCKGSLSITVTAMGCVSAGRALLRSTAHAGDLVVVSGAPGLAGYAFRLLANDEIPSDSARDALECPSPRVELGRALVGMATACIDLSDGLLADLGHVAKASGCGAEVELAKLPVAEPMRSLEPETRWGLQLGAGDDYELCFTCSPDKVDKLNRLAQSLALPLTVIGRMTEGCEVRCLRPEGGVFVPPRGGHEHFND
jgi:thiamine-monophosphate kinase